MASANRGRGTEAYINLLRYMCKKNALSVEQLTALLQGKTVPNPVSSWYLSNLCAEDKYALKQAFDGIPPAIDWPKVQACAQELLKTLVESLDCRSEAQAKTELRPIRLGWVDLRKLANLLQNGSWDRHGRDDGY